uniref:Uncharacterized protein n=1 Tax=Panagrolaimus sp. ES5 TaxID=591445 RepID=A0AC34GB18_9BILA
MFRAIIFWSILFLSITNVFALRGGLIRNGRAFNEGGGNGNALGSYQLLFFPSSHNRRYQEFMRFGGGNGNSLGSYQLLFFPSSHNRGYQEFMRFGRSNIDPPGAHQNFYRGRRDTASGTSQNFFRRRRDDSDEAESARFG